MSTGGPLETDPVDELSPLLIDTTGARVLRGGLWKLTSSTLPQLYTLIVSIVAARVLGPHGMGRQSFIAFVELATIAVLSGGLSTALMRYVAERTGAGEPGAVAGLFAWMRRLTIGTAFIGWAVLAGVALAGGDPTAAWLLAAVVCAASIMTTVPSAVLIGLQRWRDATIAGLVTGGVGTGLVVVVLHQGGGITGMFAVETITAFAGLIWTGMLARRATKAIAPVSKPIGPQLRRSVLHFALVGSVGVVLELVVWRRSEFFFLAYYSSDAQIAYYSIAFAVVNALIRIPSTAASVFAPAAAHLYGAGSHDRIRSGFGRASRLLVLLTLPIVALTLALGPRAITLVWGEDYAPAGDVLLILAASSIIVPITVLSASLLAGIRRIRALIAFDLAAATVDVTLALLLVPGHGAIGAALANAGAQLTAGGLAFAFAIRTLGRIRLGVDTIFRAALAAIGAGGTAWLIQETFSGLLGLVAGLAAGCVAFMGLIALLGVLTIDDAAFLQNAAGNRVRRPVHWLTSRLTRRGSQDK